MDRYAEVHPSQILDGAPTVHWSSHDRSQSIPPPLPYHAFPPSSPRRRGRREQRRPSRVQAPQVPPRRPRRRWARRARLRRPRRPAHLLRRHRGRRRLEIGRRRYPLETDLRRPAHRHHRVHRRGSVGPQRRLRRLRRGQHPRQRAARQRHLQVDRRRQDVEARLAAAGPDRHHDRPPDQPGYCVRRGARPRVRAERRARRLPHHRRRQDLEARPVRQPGRRRFRRLL